MSIGIFKSPFEGWRRQQRIRLTLLGVLAAGIFLLTAPFPSHRWFGLAVSGLTCGLFGLMSLLVVTVEKLAKQWLKDTAPRHMRLQLWLSAVIGLGCGIAFVAGAYLMLLDTR